MCQSIGCKYKPHQVWCGYHDPARYHKNRSKKSKSTDRSTDRTRSNKSIPKIDINDVESILNAINDVRILISSIFEELKNVIVSISNNSDTIILQELKNRTDKMLSSLVRRKLTPLNIGNGLFQKEAMQVSNISKKPFEVEIEEMNSEKTNVLKPGSNRSNLPSALRDLDISVD